MNLLEVFEDLSQGYGSEREDNTPLKFSDLCKTKLTLKQLNRLRVMNDVRKLEHEQKIEQVQQQYKAPAAEAPVM